MSRPTKIALIGFGILVVVAIIFSWRGPLKVLPNEVSSIVNQATGSNLPVLAAKMPDFADITRWWNTPGSAPLTAAGLKGKVVLVDFWTYSCINCLRTLPFLKSLNLKYSPYGLVIVGVHTPEFAFEGDPGNVDRAIKENGITYPVALDAGYGTWNAYNNEYWPADYLFDASGQLRETNFGEGNYDETEQAVRTLLADVSGKTLPPVGVVDTMPDFSRIKTQETYFGLNRGTAFMGAAGKAGADVTLMAAATPLPDKWTAGGTWRFESEYVETTAANDIFRFSVAASKLHLVMSSSDGADKTVDVFVDNASAGTFTVNAPDLYTVATFPGGGRHTVELRVRDAGVRFYSATFS
jgi:thiol-disulfide isomerase/thioredoxin